MSEQQAGASDIRTSPGSDSENIEISIVMPCLNESETLEACVAEGRQAIEDAGVSGEVVIADNGSTDGSQKIAEQASARVVNISEKDYGNALIGGIAAASSHYVMMGDADGSYNFRDLPRFLEKLQAGADLVIGCRLPKGGGTIMPEAMPWKHRWIGNPVLSGLGRIFFRSPVDDFHCGLRAFRKDAILNLDLRCTGMESASEMVVKSTFAHLKLTRYRGRCGPTVTAARYTCAAGATVGGHLRFMLLHTPKWLFLLPGLTLTLASLLGFLYSCLGASDHRRSELLRQYPARLRNRHADRFPDTVFCRLHEGCGSAARILRPDNRVKRLLDLPLVVQVLLTPTGS